MSKKSTLERRETLESLLDRGGSLGEISQSDIPKNPDSDVDIEESFESQYYLLADSGDKYRLDNLFNFVSDGVVRNGEFKNFLEIFGKQTKGVNFGKRLYFSGNCIGLLCKEDQGLSTFAIIRASDEHDDNGYAVFGYCFEKAKGEFRIMLKRKTEGLQDEIRDEFALGLTMQNKEMEGYIAACSEIESQSQDQIPIPEMEPDYTELKQIKNTTGKIETYI